MLSSISWQHYFVAVIILTSCYYGIILFRYFQQEIANIVKGKRQPDNVFKGFTPAPSSIMGEARPEYGVTFQDAPETWFAEPDPDDLPLQTPELEVSQTTIGPTQDLLIEAGNLIEAFKEIDNKPEFLTLLKILIDSYKRFQDDIDLPVALNRVLELAKEKLQFPVALTDLQSEGA